MEVGEASQEAGGRNASAAAAQGTQVGNGEAGLLVVAETGEVAAGLDEGDGPPPTPVERPHRRELLCVGVIVSHASMPVGVEVGLHTRPSVAGFLQPISIIAKFDDFINNGGPRPGRDSLSRSRLAFAKSNPDSQTAVAKAVRRLHAQTPDADGSR